MPGFQIPIVPKPSGIAHPPKKMGLAFIARPLGQTIDLLDSSRASHLSPATRAKAKEHLGYAIQMVFEAKPHSARNALVAVADVIAAGFGQQIPTGRPRGILRADATKTVAVDYVDEKSGRDLWDAITLSVTIPRLGRRNLTGSAALRAAFPATAAGFVQLAPWMETVISLAESLEEPHYWQARLDYASQLFNALAAIYPGLPASIRNEQVSDAIKGQLHLDASTPTTYEDAMGMWGLAFLFGQFSAREALKKSDWAECSVQVNALEEIDWGIQFLLCEMTTRQAAEEAAAQAEAVRQAARRDEVLDSDLWDVITGCLFDPNVKQALEDSLDDWLGAKKWIVLATCALIHIPIIVASYGAATMPAVAGFISCFVSGMIGGAALSVLLSSLGDIVECIFS